MGKHRYRHSSQTRPTCANPPAQGRCKYGKSSFFKHVPATTAPVPSRAERIPGIQNWYSWHLSLPLYWAWLVFAGQIQEKGTSVQEVHLCCSRTRQLGWPTKRPGTKDFRAWGPSSVPSPLAYILLAQSQNNKQSTIPAVIDLCIHPCSMSQTPSILYGSSYCIPQSEH